MQIIIKIKIDNAEILISANFPTGPTLPLNPAILIYSLSTLTGSLRLVTYAKHSHWYSHTRNSAGAIIFNYVGRNDYNIIAPDSPTHFPTSRFYKRDILDIALVRIPLLIQVTNLNELSSDHNPYLLDVLSSPLIINRPTTT